MSSRSSRSHSMERRAFRSSVVVQSSSSVREIGGAVAEPLIGAPPPIGDVIPASCSSLQRPYKPRFLFSALHTSLKHDKPCRARESIKSQYLSRQSRRHIRLMINQYDTSSLGGYTWQLGNLRSRSILSRK